MNANDSDIVFLFQTISAIKNGCRKKELISHLNYSEPQILRKIKKITGLTYYQLREYVWSGLVWSYKKKNLKQKDAAREMKMSEKNISIYLRRHSDNTPKTKTSKETTMKKTSNTDVLVELVTASGPKTLKELNTSVGVIRAMRMSGIAIVSKPGRYHSGYILAPVDVEHSKCLSWVNNWRESMGKSRLNKIF